MEQQIRQSEMFNGRYIESVGRRKTAVARVRLYPKADKTQRFVVNGMEVTDYFPTPENQHVAREALGKVEGGEEYDVSAIIRGGGKDAHAEALRHGIARCFASSSEETKRSLKKTGFLRHDDRQKERRKFGKKKARKSPQWSKR